MLFINYTPRKHTLLSILKMRPFASITLSIALTVHGVVSQLSGAVGPLTSVSAKAAKKTCNVLNYGAKTDGSTDLGGPLNKAFADCVNGGLGTKH